MPSTPAPHKPLRSTEHTRAAILGAAFDVYARYGFRGATTRRIAELAGVNEVTLFRHFGSKAALLGEALRGVAPERPRFGLPAVPQDPENELTAWSEDQLAYFRDKRAIIRTPMGEMEDRPELSDSAAAVPRAAFDELVVYLRRVRQDGLGLEAFDERIAAITLMGALFADAMGREMMPDIFPEPVERAPREYVALILRGIGADDVSRGAYSDATGAPRG